MSWKDFMKKWLLSRRVILALGGSLVALISKVYGVDIETVKMFLAPLIAFILGESFRDAMRDLTVN